MQAGAAIDVDKPLLTGFTAPPLRDMLLTAPQNSLEALFLRMSIDPVLIAALTKGSSVNCE